MPVPNPVVYSAGLSAQPIGAAFPGGHAAPVPRGKGRAMRVEIQGKGFHFLTVSPEGLEILGEPSGEKTVVTEIAAMASLANAAAEWVRLNRCPAHIWDGDGMARVPLHCAKKRGHEDGEEDGAEFHYATRYDPTGCIVVGHAYWSQNSNPGEDYTE